MREFRSIKGPLRRISGTYYGPHFLKLPFPFVPLPCGFETAFRPLSVCARRCQMMVRVFMITIIAKGPSLFVFIQSLLFLALGNVTVVIS